MPIGHLKADEALALGLKYHQAGQLQEAADIYGQLLNVAPQHPDLLHFMGLLKAQSGDYTSGIVQIEKAIAINPTAAVYRSNLGWVLKRDGQLDKAVASYRAAIHADPSFVDARYNLAVILRDTEQLDEALEAIQGLLERDPHHMKAKYLHAALSDVSTTKPPAEFVAQIFDEHAQSFEDHMKAGNSEIPALVKTAALQYLGSVVDSNPVPFSNTLDLGCGTGRAGVVFRDLTRQLHGVDLSEKMMEQAKEKSVYDALFLDDFIHFMTETSDTYDLVLSVDAFLYMGPLEDVFANVARLLAPSGCFGFTVEALAHGDYALRPSCRHAQSEAYIRRLADTYGFRIEICDHIKSLRFNIPGTLFWLVKI